MSGVELLGMDFESVCTPQSGLVEHHSVVGSSQWGLHCMKFILDSLTCCVKFYKANVCVLYAGVQYFITARNPSTPCAWGNPSSSATGTAPLCPQP